MNEQEVLKLYNALIGKGYSTDDLGDEQRFVSKMADANNRKQLYDWVSSNGDFRIGDYETYETRLAGANEPKPQSEDITQPEPTQEEPEPVAEQQAAPVVQEKKPVTAADAGAQLGGLAATAKSVKPKQQPKAEPKQQTQTEQPKVNIPSLYDIMDNEKEENSFAPVWKKEKGTTSTIQPPKKEGALDDYRAEADKKIRNMNRGVEAVGEKIAAQEKYRKGIKPFTSEAQRVEVGNTENAFERHNPRVVEAETQYNPITQRLEKTYLSESGNEYTNRTLAEREQAQIDKDIERELKPIETQLADAYEERDRLNEMMSKRREEIRAAFKDAPQYFNPEQDDEYKRLKSAYRKNKSLITTLEDVHNKTTNNFWHSFAKDIADGYKFDFGKSRIEDVLFQSSAKKHIDSINKKRANGESLTHEEELAEAVLKNSAWDNQVQDKYGDRYGAWARAGKMGATSLDFMFDFMMMGGLPKATATGILKGVEKYGEKALGKYATEGLGKYMLKATGATLGSMVAGAEIANTIEIGKVGAEAAKNYQGDVYRDEQGNYFFGHKESDGEGGTIIVKGGETALDAVLDAERNYVTENASEMAGFFMPSGKAIVKGFEKVGLSKISNWLTALSGKQWYKNYTAALESVGFNGFVEEPLEEYAGAAYDFMLGGDEWKNLADKRTHIDIWLGCTTMGAFLNAPRIVGTGFQTAQYYRYKHNTDKADKAANFSLTEEVWKPMREKIDNATNGQMADVVMEILNDNNLSNEQWKSVLDYVGNLQKMRGYSLGSIASEERTENPEPKTEEEKVAHEIDQSYAEGYNTTEQQEKNDAKNKYEYERQRIAQITTEEGIAYLDENPLEALDSALHDDDWSEEERQAALDYVNAKATYDGMMRHVEDDIDSQIAESDRLVGERTHRDGMIHPVTLNGDRKVYIVDGRLAQLADGSVDVQNSEPTLIVRGEDGKIEYISPSDIASVDESIDAEEERNTAAQAIRESVTQTATAEIEGTLPFNNGDQYNVIDDEGLPHVVTIIDNGQAQDGAITIGGGMMKVSIDGEELDMTRNRIQDWANNANLARLAEHEQERQQKREEETEQGDNNLVAGAPAEYTQGLNIVVSDEDGNEMDAVVGGRVRYEDGQFVPDENGNMIEYLVGNEVRHDYINDLNDKVVGYNVSEEETGSEQAVVEASPETTGANEATAATTEEPVAETEPTDTDAMPMNGEEPDFLATTPERGHRYLFEESGWDADEANQFIEANKKAADKALTTIQGKKPKMGTSVAKYNTEKAEWQAKVDAAQAAADYWNAVASIEENRANALTSGENVVSLQGETLNADERQAMLDEQKNIAAKIATAKQLYGDYFDSDFAVPQDVNELVAMNMPKEKISWEGREGVRGLQQELGSNFKRRIGRTKGSTYAFNQYLAKKGEGISTEKAIHDIWESPMNQLPEGEKRWDTEEIRAAFIDMFMNAVEPTDIRDYVYNSRIRQAEQMKRAEEEAAEIAQMDEDIRQRMGMEREEYDAWIADMTARAEAQAAYETETYNETNISDDRGTEESTGTEGTGEVQGQEGIRVGTEEDNPASAGRDGTGEGTGRGQGDLAQAERINKEQGFIESLRRLLYDYDTGDNGYLTELDVIEQARGLMDELPDGSEIGKMLDEAFAAYDDTHNAYLYENGMRDDDGSEAMIDVLRSIVVEAKPVAEGGVSAEEIESQEQEESAEAEEKTLPESEENSEKGLENQEKSDTFVLTLENLEASDLDEAVKSGARAWLNGDKSPANQLSFLAAQDYVRDFNERTERSGSNADGAQLGSEDNGVANGETGRGNGEGGFVDTENDAEGVSADRAGRADSSPDVASRDGERGDRGLSQGESADGDGSAVSDTTRGRNGRSNRSNGKRRGRGSSSTISSRDAGGNTIADAKAELDEALKDFEDILKESFTEPAKGKLLAADPVSLYTYLGAVKAIKLITAGSKVAYAAAKLGYYEFKEWFDVMKAKLGALLRDYAGMDDEQIDGFIEMMWDYDITVDGETRKVREWASMLSDAKLREQMSLTIEEKRKLQAEAESTPTTIADITNIRESLPFLLPKQQEDVQKAERQFFTEEHADAKHGHGKGYMFTNGTGTGKTYTGLGIVKRFIKQGKKRILIVTAQETKINDWIRDAKNLGIEATMLPDTKTKGSGVVVTQYANMRQNRALLEDEFDLIVYDESHKLMENQDGTTTSASIAHHMLSNRDERQAARRVIMGGEFGKRYYEAKDELELLEKALSTPTTEWTDEIRDAVYGKYGKSGLAMLDDRVKELRDFIEKFEERLEEEVDNYLSDSENAAKAREAAAKTKVVFLSATPFNTPANLDYTEGYIFSYSNKDEVEKEADRLKRRDSFLIDKFNASHQRNAKTNTVTRITQERISDPLKASEEEVAFSDYMQNDLETMSGRDLDSEYDYSREFPKLDFEMADLFNDAIQSLSDGRFNALADYFDHLLNDYNTMTAYLEIFKAQMIAPRIKEYIDLGKKVTLFHRRKASNVDIFPPFALAMQKAREAAKEDNTLEDAVEAFEYTYRKLFQWEGSIDYMFPQESILNEFMTDKEKADHAKAVRKWSEENDEALQTLVGELMLLNAKIEDADSDELSKIKKEIKEKNAAVDKIMKARPKPKCALVSVFNGSESAKDRADAVADFNNDNGKTKVLVVQVQSGKEGISLHDTTGKFPRVQLGIFLPQSPIEFIQTEGRIFRVGNKSNAIFEYPLLGLDIELSNFALKINGRSETTENLALGSRGRGLKESISRSALASRHINPADAKGVGGKELDNRKAQQADGFSVAVKNYDEWRNEEKPVDANDIEIPDPIGYMMSKWGYIENGERVLTPNARRGSIARYIPTRSRLTAMEQRNKDYARLSALIGGSGRKVLNEGFEGHSLNNKYDIVVMNTDHSVTEGRNMFGVTSTATDVTDVNKAFKHLEDSGRVIALVVGNRAGEIMSSLKQQYSDAVPVAEIKLPAFVLGGTQSSIVVIDKIDNKELKAQAGEQQTIDLSGAADEDALFAQIRDVVVPERHIDKVGKVSRRVRGMATAFINAGTLKKEKNWRTKKMEPVFYTDYGYLNAQFAKGKMVHFSTTRHVYSNFYIEFKRIAANDMEYISTLANEWVYMMNQLGMSDEELYDKYRHYIDYKEDRLGGVRDSLRAMTQSIELALDKTPMQLRNIAEGRVENEVSGSYTLEGFIEVFKSLNADNAELEALAEKVFSAASQIEGLQFKVLDGDAFKSRASHNVAAHYVPSRNIIELNGDVFNSIRIPDSFKAQTTVHETIHALTCWAIRAYKDEYTRSKLTPTQQEACKTIMDVYSQINNDDFRNRLRLGSSMEDNAEYGLTNEEEMMAELANPVFRAALKAKNLWRQIVNGIKMLLGIEIPGVEAEKTDALTALDNALDTLLNTYDANLYAQYTQGDYSSTFPMQMPSAMNDIEEIQRRWESLAQKYKGKPYNVVTSIDEMDDEEFLRSIGVTEEEISAMTAEEIRDNAEIDKKYAKGKKLGGGYSPMMDKIVIFAENISSPNKIEEAFFHENLHGVLFDVYGEAPQTIAEHFWDAVEEGLMTKEEVAEGYGGQSDYVQKVEYFVYNISKAMVSGRVSELLGKMSADDTERIDNILNALGYDRRAEETRRAEEASRRAEGQAQDILQENLGANDAGLLLEGEDDVREVAQSERLYRKREQPAPKKTGIGYKVFVLKDGKLYPPMVANPNGEPTPMGEWLDADAAPVAGTTKTGRQQVKAGGKGTQGGSGMLAYRPGWHLGEIPYALQFGRVNPETGKKELFPANFVWAEVEYANDVDYQQEAHDAGVNANGKYQHSLAGLPRVPENGSYRYRTNPNPETDEWIITGAMKVNRILTPTEVDEMVKAAGREPQPRQKGAVTDEQVRELNAQISPVLYRMPMFREGFGGITYEESLAISKAAGYTKKQHDAWWKRTRRTAEDMAEKMHISDIVTIVERADELEDFDSLTEEDKQSKGWFDPKTGKIVIILGNHAGAHDVLQTMLHEGVNHYGLRKMFGKHFDTFLKNVYNNASPEIRNEINKLMSRNGWNYETATEEYLGKLAEDTDFENAEKSGWWHQIKEWFLNMLRSVGLDRFFAPYYDSLSDNELRYLLWRSYQNLVNPNRYRSLVDTAIDIAKQYELGVGKFAENAGSAERVAESSSKLHRDGDFTPRDRAVVRDEYERIVSTGSYQFREAVQDSMLGLRRAMESIDKGTRIEDVPDSENAYTAENAMSSANSAQQSNFLREYMMPLLNAIHAIAGDSAEKREELIDYMMAKHGLERNEKFAARDAREEADATDGDYDALYERNRKKDYSGLTALTGASTTFLAEKLARDKVEAYEAQHDTTDLWVAVNNATKTTLAKIRLGGLLSQERYEQIRDQFEYYIPLRGWDETTSDEVYGYLTSKDSPLMGGTIKHAYGRMSKADDPIATIAMMADNAIMQANRNDMKQRFLTFVENHPSDLVSVNRLWLQYDEAADEWKPVFADIESSDTPRDVERKVKAFEERMEQLAEAEPEKYKHGKDAVNIPYKVVKGNLREHQVLVKRDGETFVLTINGNPRAAQALNGITNPDVEAGGLVGNILKAEEYIVRFLSALYTTMTPDFVISNFFRDMLYSNCMTWTKGSPSYARTFHKNFGRVNPAIMGRLFKKWESGTLDESNELERQFKTFLLNGGETGYTNVRDIEAHKKAIAAELKRMSSTPRKAWRALTLTLDMMNRSVENCARFAAFLTSQEMGRSIGRSIYDAKEISVNFNKKGAGGKMVNAVGQTDLGKVGSYISGAGRLLYVFWNAGVQGMTNFGRAARRNKGKFAAGAASIFSLGAIMPLVAMAVGGDDDEYYDLPEYVRRSNICFRWSKDMPWITIPLPIEFRALYGLGELATGVITGKEHYSDGELARNLISQVSQILPLDFMEGGGGLHAFIPSPAKPLVEAASNKSWTGLPIYRDTANKQNYPEYTKVYKNADKYIVGASKWLNEFTGGDEYKKGWADVVNPSQIEYMLNGYFGGFFKVPNQLVKMAETAFGDREFDWRNMMLANRLLKNGDESTQDRKLRNAFFRYKEEYEETKRLLNDYNKAVEKGELKYVAIANDLKNSEAYQRYIIFDEYRGIADALNNAANEATDEERKASLLSAYYDVLDDMVKDIESLNPNADEHVDSLSEMAFNDSYGTNLRKKIGSDIARRLGGKDSYGSPDTEYGRNYEKARDYVDIAADVTLQVMKREAKESGNTRVEKGLDKYQRKITELKHNLTGVIENDDKVMERIRSLRQKALDWADENKEQ